MAGQAALSCPLKWSSEAACGQGLGNNRWVIICMAAKAMLHSPMDVHI